MFRGGQGAVRRGGYRREEGQFRRDSPQPKNVRIDSLETVGKRQLRSARALLRCSSVDHSRLVAMSPVTMTLI